MRAISLAKFEEGVVNEDAAIAKKKVIAVSDGAGGGGVYAERWSQYLVNNLPNTPFIILRHLTNGLMEYGSLFIMNVRKKPKKKVGCS